MKRWLAPALGALSTLLGSLVILVPACHGGRSQLRIGDGDQGTGGGAGRGGAAAGTPTGTGGSAGSGGNLDCAPQEAWADGPCAAELPGVAWRGDRCEPLGSGCSCVGADCGEIYPNVEACVVARRHCYAFGCEAQAVHDDSCEICPGGSFLGAFWDGRECRELYGCACAGAACDELFASAAECEAVHAPCDARRCTATGGTWFPAAAGFCGFSCGAPVEPACEAPIDACACPTGETFLAVTGCTADPNCTDADRCRADRGTWHPASDCFCGFSCGQPNDCQACIDSCDCGPHRTFVSGWGCSTDASCGSPLEAEICAATGGVWQDCTSGPCGCGHYECGRPNLVDPCVAPGCDCGWLGSFDAERGCVLEPSCVFRDLDQPCSGLGTEWSTCRAGLACCEQCGVAPGCAACLTPCCPSDPFCEPTGCYPPPP